MPAYCAAYGCSKHLTPGSQIKLYRFPRAPERRKAWTDALKRKGYVATNYSRICNDHFVTGKCLRLRIPDYVTKKKVRR
jgi:hypothetical protein